MGNWFRRLDDFDWEDFFGFNLLLFAGNITDFLCELCAYQNVRCFMRDQQKSFLSQKSDLRNQSKINGICDSA